MEPLMIALEVIGLWPLVSVVAGLLIGRAISILNPGEPSAPQHFAGQPQPRVGELWTGQTSADFRQAHS